MVAPRGGAAKSGGALPKLLILCPKTVFFGRKRPRNPFKTTKRRETVATLHVRLDCPVTKSPLSPSSAIFVKLPQNQERAVSWATWLKTKFRGHLVHPQTPTFCGFQASESPNKTPRPLYQWSIGGAIGQPGPRMVGANSASNGVPRTKN